MDESQLQVTRKDGDSSLSLSKARSNLVARGRRDAAMLNDYERCSQAAEQGDAEEQFTLGRMYHYGEGFTQDYAEAAKWYRKAAEQGDDLSQCQLGVMYTFGQGVAQDYGEAAKWFREAADRGSDKAQFNLGLLYKFGAGVVKDYVRAHMWMSLGAAHAEMTPAQIADAQRFAQWLFEEERIKPVIDIMEALKQSLETRKNRPSYPGWTPVFTDDEQFDIKRAATIGKLEAEMTPAQIAEAQRLARLFEEERRKAPGSPAVIDIMEALKRSLEARKNRSAGHLGSQKE
ncbi:MAG: hypothetical protein ABSG41_24780 [Bryobacteraceae bacterium]|jgi:hypothetical protein